MGQSGKFDVEGQNHICRKQLAFILTLICKTYILTFIYIKNQILLYIEKTQQRFGFSNIVTESINILCKIKDNKAILILQCHDTMIVGDKTVDTLGQST